MRKKATAGQETSETTEQKKEFSLIPHETLMALYANLVKCRMLEARTQRKRKNGKAAGYEAVTVGVAMDLGTGDALDFPVEDGPSRLLFGEPLRSILTSRHEHVLGADERLQTAVGAALLHKTRKTGKVSVVFWREDASDAWKDALETARAHKLPLVFVSEMALADRASSAAPAEAGRGKKKREELEPGTELPHITVDGADVVAVYRVAHEAIDRARRDRGPSLIECVSFRLPGQRRAKNGDSVANMEVYLRGKGLLRRGLRRETEAAFEAELAEARRRRVRRARAKG